MSVTTVAATPTGTPEVVRVSKTARDGHPAAYLSIGNTDVVISDPSDLMRLAHAFADLADDSEQHDLHPAGAR